MGCYATRRTRRNRWQTHHVSCAGGAGAEVIVNGEKVKVGRCALGYNGQRCGSDEWSSMAFETALMQNHAELCLVRQRVVQGWVPGAGEIHQLTLTWGAVPRG